jgi:hypothetical protein
MTEKHKSGSIGSVALLGRLNPCWVVVLTILFSTGAIGALRVITEGAYYDRSLASRPGDSLLGVYLAAASWIIRKDDSTLDSQRSVNIEGSWVWHCATAATGLVAGVALQLIAESQGKQTPANTYHNLAVISTLTYFVVSVLPVVARTRHRKAQLVALVGLLGWLGLLIWDIKAGNLQRNSSRWAMP